MSESLKNLAELSDAELAVLVKSGNDSALCAHLEIFAKYWLFG